MSYDIIKRFTDVEIKAVKDRLTPMDEHKLIDYFVLHQKYNVEEVLNTLVEIEGRYYRTSEVLDSILDYNLTGE